MGAIEIGAVLDERYRILERRASGATATVWKAQDELLRRPVAVKVLHEHLASDHELLERFIAEAHTAATVSHPALVAVYDSIRDQPGIVLEWVDGPDLRQRLDRGPIRPGDVATIGATLCDGLGALHARGLIHRDVKPANILLRADGATKLTDFGIATANAGDRTATGIVLGTAKYLAPEQVRSTPLDGRTDLFALCAVLYEALAGQAPWTRDSDLATALARLEDDPIDLQRLQPELDPTLAATVMRGLAREPEARWPDAAALAAALRGEAPMAAPTAPGPEELVGAPAGRRADPTITLAGAAPAAATTSLPIRTVEAPRPRHPPLPLWPRILGWTVVGAIAVLGWTLIASVGGTRPPAGRDARPATITTAEPFDPEGSGPPGEHNELAGRLIDGDPTTAWTTERYDLIDLGTKSGVGLVFTLDAVTEIESVEVTTLGGEGWSADVRIATDVSPGEAGGIDAFGPSRGGGRHLATDSDIPVTGRGNQVVLWITELGGDGPPFTLRIAEVTIR
ncbi:MAG: serine/threonine-protein kinase [Acidimicrobiales bacterium]